MSSRAATGPWAITCSRPSSVRATTYGARLSGTPCQTSTRLPTSDRGSRTQSSARTRSTQKLPSVADRSRANPRMNATPTASPAAPARKFCDASPTTWVR